MLGKIFEERQSAVNAEQERQAVLEGQIDQAKGVRNVFQVNAYLAHSRG